MRTQNILEPLASNLNKRVFPRKILTAFIIPIIISLFLLFTHTAIALNITIIEDIISIKDPINITIIEDPIYRDGELIIPRVDTDEQEGRYRDIKFQYDSATGMWKLFYFPLYEKMLQVTNIETIVTDTIPAQVFLKISGINYDICQSPIWKWKDYQRLVENEFKITIYDKSNFVGVTCSAYAPDFSEIVTKIIPLQVYDLPAGTYKYSVNNSHFGSFTLTTKNTLTQMWEIPGLFTE